MGKNLFYLFDIGFLLIVTLTFFLFYMTNSIMSGSKLRLVYQL